MINTSSNKTVVTLFEEQVKRTPRRIALVADDGRFTYQKLDEQINQLAHYLKSQGVGPNKLVAVHIGRSANAIISILAILKLGAAYLPLNVNDPQSRLRDLLNDSDSDFLLTLFRTSVFDDLINGINPIVLEEQQAEIADQPITGLDSPANLDSLAVVIFTSGSTGQPKGIEIDHRAIQNLIVNQIDILELTSSSRVLQFASLYFDVSLLEILASLLSGASLYVPTDSLRANPPGLLSYLHLNRITLAVLPPALLSTFPKMFNSPLQTLVVTGDTCPKSIMDVWYSQCRVLNNYGPAETTVWSTMAVYDGERNRCIGYPLPNVSCYVLKPDLKEVAIGEVGELYIGGMGLARGYRNHPELTAEKFITVKLDDTKIPTRLYKTGDRVKLLADGSLEFIGRVDFEIKFNGVRIDPVEIETPLNNHPAVEHSHIALHKRDGKQYLTAYIVSKKYKKLTSQMLREHLKRYLPANRIPNVFMFLKSFPLSATGKIDREALPLPHFDQVDAQSKLLSNNERDLRLFWTHVLSVSENNIGPDTDFFSLGGTSLLASQLATRLSEHYDIQVTLADILDNSTLRTLAAKIHDLAKENKLPIIQMQSTVAKLPMSFAQKRLWLAYQAAQDQHPQTYNEKISIEFTGELDVEALRRALQSLANRHEILRTYFPNINIQAVTDQPFTLEEMVLEKNLASIIDEIADTNFGDLSKPFLMRAVLIRVSANRNVLCLVFHHIIIDGMSFPILLRDLNQYYNHYAGGVDINLPSLPVQYSDYALWEQKIYESGYYEQACNYWKSQLKGASGIMGLPLDNPRPKQMTFIGGTHIFYTSNELSAALKALAKEHEVSLFTVLLSTVVILFYRYSQQEDFIVGVAHGERADPVLNDAVGFFVNMLPIRVHQYPKMTVTQVLHEVHNKLLLAYQNNAPIETILDKLHLPQQVGAHPLFQLMVTLHNTPPVDCNFHNVAAKQLESSIVEIANKTSAKFDLSFEIEPLEDGRIAIRIDYARDLFKLSTIERISQQWLDLSTCLVNNPGEPINYLSLLSEEEQQKKITELVTRSKEFHPEINMLDLFKEQVQKQPNATAIHDGNLSITYRQLNEQANQLAHFLVEDNNAPCADTCIAIALDRSANFIISALAILKTGAAYLPLDPELPKLRLKFMLEDASIKKVITDTVCQDRLPESKAKIICLDQSKIQVALSKKPNHDPHNAVSPRHLAYVIYTSGTTGKPKGVMVEHRRVSHLAKKNERIIIEPKDVVAHVCNVTFDVSVFEIWGGLLNGASLVIYPKATLLNPVEFKESLVSHKVTVLLLTTALFNRFLIADLSIFSSLKYVVFLGEKLGSTRILRDLAKLEPHKRPTHVINGYGPTEDTAFSTTYEINFDIPIPDDLPIGMPIFGTQAYVLNDQLQPVADGILGELHLGGAGLARGYLNQHELTQQRFIDNPFSDDGDKLYRTGDLVRYRPSEGLVYIKRADKQVKISGYRIELDGITKAILSQTYVKEAIVLKRMVDGRPTLVAYVSQRINLLSAEDFKQVLRHNLSEILPHYMLPSVFVVLDSLPLSLNGKIDIYQLPSVSFESNQEYVPPTTPIELELLELWQSVLPHQKKISIKDSFFSLGGSSLLAMQLTGMINEKYGSISYTDLFTQPTIESHAQLVKTPEQQRITPTLDIEFLKQEAVLDDDIRHSYKWTKDAYPTHPKNIFLTGATGFLGVFLLDELLKTTDATIYCLIRADDISHANARFAQTLGKYRLTISQENLHRIRWVIGDLSRPSFGLSEARYFELASLIDIIYHCASNVNFVKPYLAVKNVNVDGTLTILRFAISQHMKPIHYVSTATIFTYVHYFRKVSVLLEEEIIWDEIYGKALPHDLGYVQSKSVAEKLMWQAKARGIPVAIHRAGFILCHSETGVGSLEQLWAMLVKDCIAIGCYPRFLELRGEYVTVDFVSKAIAQISKSPDCIGKAFHLVPTHENNITTDTFFHIIQMVGPMMKAKSLRKWRAMMQEYISTAQSSALELLMPLFTDAVQDGLTLLETYQTSPEYSVTNTLSALEGSGIKCPPIDQTILKRYIRYLLDKEWNTDTDYGKITQIKTEICVD